MQYMLSSLSSVFRTRLKPKTHVLWKSQRNFQRNSSQKKKKAERKILVHKLEQITTQTLVDCATHEKMSSLSSTLYPHRRFSFCLSRFDVNARVRLRRLGPLSLSFSLLCPFLPIHGLFSFSLSAFLFLIPILPRNRYLDYRQGWPLLLLPLEKNTKALSQLYWA